MTSHKQKCCHNVHRLYGPLAVHNVHGLHGPLAVHNVHWLHVHMQLTEASLYYC